MSDIKKYLSLEGLGLYHNRIKGYIDEADKNLSDELALLQNLVGQLDAKLGDWGSENSDSDFVSVESAIAEIKDLIENIRKEGGENDDKIEEAINGIEGELEGITTAIEKLNGEDTVDGSVKNIAKSYAEAAQEAAQAYVDGKVDGKFDERGAAAAAQDAAATDAQTKANTAEANAINHANSLVKNEDGSAKFDAAGSADAAKTAANTYADSLATNYDKSGSAAQALADAKAYVVDNFDLKYEGNIIHIIGENGAKIGDGIDASAFVTEGILKDVEFAFVDGSESDSDESNNTTLRLTFDTDKGDKVIDIDFKDYVDIYRADGTSLSLDSTTNTFSIREVAADKTKLNSDITIAGGPLANNIAETGDEWPWTDSAGNKIIPQGKSMEEILTGLFLKVIEGTVSFGNVSWSPTIDKPTVTLSKSGTIEVGTKVKVTALSKGDFKKEKRSVKLTATQGYFDGDTYYSDKTKMFYSAESTSSGTETISCTWNNVATDIVVNETELVAEEGVNTLVATQSGLTATVSAIPTKTVNASTNTKTKLTDTTSNKKQVATFTETQETYTSNTLSNSNNAKVTAYYPIYTNGKAGSDGNASSETTLVANDATKLGLVENNTAFYVNFAPMIDGGTGYRLLVKSGKTIKEAMALNTLNGKYEVNMLSSFVKADGTVDKASGDTTFAYDVYEAKGTAGANAIRFKID